MRKILLIYLLLGSIMCFGQSKLERKAFKRLKRFEKEYNQRKYEGVSYPGHGKMKIDSVFVDSKTKKIEIYSNGLPAYAPFREENLQTFRQFLKKRLKRKFRHYDLKFFCANREIESLVPNFYRSQINKDDSKRFKHKDSKNVVKNLSKPYSVSKGLNDRTVALWHSHGWYYEPKLNRWEWQRARVFETVEDLYPTDYVLNYITPMLENAGANVFLPRERDTQINEVIIDNDNSDKNIPLTLRGNSEWKKGASKGFAMRSEYLYEGENPFAMGSYLEVETNKKASVKYIPEIPQRGKYAVYISYKSLPESVDDVKYKVYHLGGATTFNVNQKIGGGTWIYLGHFDFAKGSNKNNGIVEVLTDSKSTGIVTTDAVKFGGGKGNVVRGISVEEFAKIKKIEDSETVKKMSRFVNNKPSSSGRARFMEASRYYLQFAGMPSETVYNLNGEIQDYKDDYQSRGEWVNYLVGSPFGPTRKEEEKGLGIPVELCLGFHTDAGVTHSDRIIGTLAIYSSQRYKGSDNFPNGISRMANRDFADIMQTQIVNDIRHGFNKDWTRRGMWDKFYSEAWRPNVPSVLLELLSHQNFADMRFGLDPEFKFTVSRAIYKSMLKFLSSSYGFEYVVQPLPVDNFCAEFSGDNKVLLKWKSVEDPLEPTAKAEKYIIYTKIGDGGYDNGVVSETSSIELNIEKDKIYSYKVSAVNDGGESFPSEELSVCKRNNSKPVVMVVNGFDRVSAPESIDKGDFRGFISFKDNGVANRRTHSYIGAQYDFADKSQWKDDDEPGFGASYANMEGKTVVGNTFNYSFIHGKSISDAGFSFVSSSDEALENEMFDAGKYKVLDLCFGEEKTTIRNTDSTEFYKIYTPKLMEVLKNFCKKGNNIIISGAYIGTESVKDSVAGDFVKSVLKFRHRTNHATKTGAVMNLDNESKIKNFKFETEFNDSMYKVESPDGVVPADKDAFTLFRYKDNNVSAATIYLGEYKVIAIGFPFETIVNSEERDKLMSEILNYFE